MSSWGLEDNLIITGTVTVADDSPNVDGSSTLFLMEVKEGDYIGIAGTKYQVDVITSNTFMTIKGNAATNSSGVAAYLQTGPKYIGNVALEDNVYTIQRVYGVSTEEAGVPANRQRNLKNPGWAHFQQYTGGHGQVRVKGETLVALSKNFKDAEISDWDDDAVLLDYLLYFATQPVDQEVAANSNVTIQTAAASIPSGATISYQWYESPNNIVYATLSNTGVYSGTTTNTLAIANVANLDGYYYKLEISSSAAETNTSDIITITHL